MELASSSASSMNWPAPPHPAGYPWPAPPPMSAMPPMGVRPPMMFGPLPAGFPPGNFQQLPRLPFPAAHETAGDESQETGADGEISTPEGGVGGGDNYAEESLHQDGDNIADIAHMGNVFPRPMGGGDWRIRGPVPFMRGPNMPRPDLMRGPRPLLGDIPGPPRGLLGPPPLLRPPPSRFGMPQNFPNVEEGNDEYCDEYGGEEEEGGNEEEYEEEQYDEEQYDEEQYDEECEEFPNDGDDHFICFSFALLIAVLFVEISHTTGLALEF